MIMQLDQLTFCFVSAVTSPPPLLERHLQKVYPHSDKNAAYPTAFDAAMHVHER